MIGEGKTVSTKNLEFASQFPKNYLLGKLKEFFEKVTELEDKLEQQKKYTESLVKEIDSMTDGQTISEKEKLIKGYRGSISEKDKLIEGYRKSVEEQKEYTSRSLSEKEKLIEGYSRSITENEKIITGYEDSIKKLKRIIQGHESSIKEQKDYIENLEKNIRDLESRLGKLAFWKKK